MLNRNQQKLTENLLNLLEKYINKKIILVEQSMKLAKQNFLKKGLISPEDFEQIVTVDPSRTKKYVYWMCKQYANKSQNIDLSHLFNIITEFDTLCRAGRFGMQIPDLPDNLNPEHRANLIRRRQEQGGTRAEILAQAIEGLNIKGNPSDINSYKTFKDLEAAVEGVNHKVQEFNAEDEKKNDYWVSVDNEDMLVADPKTHEASYYLGSKDFIFPESTKYPDKCPWCTTYGDKNHFYSMYDRTRITFYYIKARGEFKKELIDNGLISCVGCAMQVNKDGSIVYWDANDSQMGSEKTRAYKNIFNKYFKKAGKAGQIRHDPNTD